MLIGIDVGGTKNELVLCDNSGKVLSHMLAPGSNASEFGAEVAAQRVAEQARALVAGFPGAAVDALYGGFAGGTAPRTKALLHARLSALLPFARRIGNGSDALNGLYACVGVRDGMVVIAGTGSSAFVRHGGELSQVGGWGYLVDDAGSGFSIGRGALNAAFRHADGRGPATLLTALCEKKLGDAMPNVVPVIYDGGKRLIASCALLAFEAADAGDAVALSLVDTACDELALLIRTCAKRLPRAPYLVGLSGSVWKAARVREGVRARLTEDYRLIAADLPPVFGATLAAAELAGVDGGDAFHDAFAASFAQVPILKKE